VSAASDTPRTSEGAGEKYHGVAHVAAGSAGMQPAAAHVEVSDEFIVREGEGGGGAGSDPDAQGGLRYVSVVESPGRRAEPGATLGVSMLTSFSDYRVQHLST
jgi:hypothetical protein